MSDSLSPRRYEQRGGIPSRADALAEDLNRLSDAAIQHISVVGGTVRRFGNSVCIEVPGPRGGGGGGTYRGVITQCADSSGVGKARRIVQGELENEQVDVIIKRGLWCDRIGEECLLHVAADDIAPYIAADYINFSPGQAGTGDFTPVSTPMLALKQLSVPPSACEGT